MCPQSKLIYVISQLRLSFQMNLGCIRLVVNAKILCMYVYRCVCVCCICDVCMCVHIFPCKYAHLPVEDKVWYMVSFFVTIHLFLLLLFFSDASLTYSRALWYYANWPASLRYPSVCAPSCWDYRGRMPCLAFYINTCDSNSGHPAVQHVSLHLIPKIGFECLFSSYWQSLGDWENFRSWNLEGRRGSLEVFASCSPALIALYFLVLAPRILWFPWW